MSRRLVLRIAAVAGVAFLVAFVAFIGKAWWDSRLPDTYSVMSYGMHDFGGGPEPAAHEGHGGAAGISVADLHGPGTLARMRASSSIARKPRCGSRRAERSRR